MPGADVLTAHEFSQRSRNYWLFSTGAGISVISSSILALFVGVVIAAQTLYASTMDRLPEYATLRAMGGPRSYLYAIVIKQALIGGFLGYLLGISIVYLLVHLSRDSSAPPEMTWWLALGIGAVTELMCVAASILSLRKITSKSIPSRCFDNGTGYNRLGHRAHLRLRSDSVHGAAGDRFEIRRGELLLLMGPSGSGKTTLLKSWAACCARPRAPSSCTAGLRTR